MRKMKLASCVLIGTFGITACVMGQGTGPHLLRSTSPSARRAPEASPVSRQTTPNTRPVATPGSTRKPSKPVEIQVISANRRTQGSTLAVMPEPATHDPAQAGQAPPNAASVPGQATAEGMDCRSQYRCYTLDYCPGHHCCCDGSGCYQSWCERFKSCMQASHWGYPEEFEVRPFGAPMCDAMEAQTINGVAARMVLYQYDFYSDAFHDAAELNPHGRRRLGRLACMWQSHAFPLVIERSRDNPALDAARRQYVLQILRESAVEVPEECVIVGMPRAAGLSGEEAVDVHANMLLETRLGGGGTFRQPPYVAPGSLGLPSGTELGP